MTADAGAIAAVVAVELAAEVVGDLADHVRVVANDHGGSATDRVATFGTVPDALLAGATLLKDLPGAGCGVVILDGADIAAAVSLAREAASEADQGQIVVSALRQGTATRLGVLRGNRESTIFAKALAQAPIAVSDDDPVVTDDDLRTKLSAAEYRVAEAVGQGATNKEVAGRLFISVKTVDYHLQNIYRKLGARSRTELAVLVAGSNRVAAARGLTEAQLRFLNALADQPTVARWGSGVHGIDLRDETGD